MSLPTNINALAAWTTLALVALGAYFFIKDTKRAMDAMPSHIRDARKAESERDAEWKLDEEANINRILSLIREHWQQREDRFEELERGQIGILESLAKTREAIARHQGHHDRIGD